MDHLRQILGFDPWYRDDDEADVDAEVPLLEGEEYTEVGVEAILSNLTFKSCRLSTTDV